MTAAVQITDAMHAHLKADLSKSFQVTALKMDKQVSNLTTYPMTTLTQVIKFSIHPAGETLREFTFTASLVEQTTPDGTPTAGWVDAT